MADKPSISLEEYISKSWDDLLINCEETEEHLYLPHPFIAPSVRRHNGFVFNEQFYWDTYFTIVGLKPAGKLEIVKGMVENLLYLHDRLGYVPNSNARYHLGRSQPPLLSSMVLIIFEITNDVEWLSRAYSSVNHEYRNVWTANEYPHNRNVFRDLSRYYHADQSHSGAEDESGWDYTTRFEDRAIDFLPIDLNSLLYKYEADLAFIASILEKKNEQSEWQFLADKRKNTINELMWHEKDGTFYDYDYVNERQGRVKSLAAYTTMFSGLADEMQAKKLVKNLPLFQTKHGLTTTPKDNNPIEGKQWTAPNGWAPLHLFVTEGLFRYEFKAEAESIMKSWIQTVRAVYNKTGLVLEKYNMVNPFKPPTSAVYPDQTGFGWTNAVTAHYLSHLKQ
ncbi:MAG: trehalase family glycosidase [Candidatus Saccharimonadales bacterium]|nr:trehalase family glycosidase [Candidatus Saccharimonadales bacterium]